MICKHCHHELPPDVRSCPHCGGEVEVQQESLPLWSDTGLEPLGPEKSPHATSINVKRYDAEALQDAPATDPSPTWGAGDEAGQPVFTSAGEREDQTEKKKPRRRASSWPGMKRNSQGSALYSCDSSLKISRRRKRMGGSVDSLLL